MYWWLFLAGFPSFLYAVTNHIDDHLLEKEFQGDSGVPALLLISALVSIIAIPFIWVGNEYSHLWFEGVFMGSGGSLLPENSLHLLVFALIGLLHTALLWFYLQALKIEDTTTIIIFYSFLPVLGLLTSNIFLGEELLPMQLVSMAIIIVAVVVVALARNNDGKFVFKLKAAGLIFMASLCWALGDVVFKAVAIEENIWRVLFWEHIMLFIVGLVILVSASKVRAELKNALRINSIKIITLNLTNESLYIMANVLSAFPLLMVQIAAVHLVQAFQPVWVFLIALVLVHYGKEHFTKIQLIQKITATTLAVYGMYLLAASTPV